MTGVPLVSVVVPTYNRAGFLAEALESVLTQDFEDWELIVVDDGSTDSTMAQLSRVHDRRVHCIRQDNRGVAGARNRGVAAARGTWIAFLDSDDLWKPAKLQRQLEALQREGAYRLCHTDEIWIRDGRRLNQKKIHQKRGGWLFEDSLRLCVVSPSSVLMHRGVLETFGGFDEEFPVCEDYELWLRLSCRLPFLHVPEPLVVKRGGHPDQLSRSRWGMDRYRVQALLKTWENCPLTPRLRRLTALQIARKSAILAHGCKKWNRPREARLYSTLATDWEAEAARYAALMEMGTTSRLSRNLTVGDSREAP